MRRFIVLSVLALALACHIESAWALITYPLHLQQLIEEQSDYIFLAKVERVDPERPAMVLTVADQQKGKAPFERMAVNLTGDKEKHTPKLLKRVAPDVEMVVFVHKDSKGQLMALAFTNGTWVQLVGYPDGKNYRFAFTHCETYLRRTFRGTTEELKTLIASVLAKKKRAPPYDPKVPPGFGPELEATAKQKP